MTTSTRYCPSCLAGDGSAIQQRHSGPWQLAWRLAANFACLEHRFLPAHHLSRLRAAGPEDPRQLTRSDGGAARRSPSPRPVPQRQ
ncbi:TniQ family protein [Streptomyces sp. NPDC048484]|uniref:TniQ family protein n=1 Tax=Streptomyces sp. NPDC048484 TaxID=3155146 RepID=UPI0034246FA7